MEDGTQVMAKNWWIFRLIVWLKLYKSTAVYLGLSGNHLQPINLSLGEGDPKNHIIKLFWGTSISVSGARDLALRLNQMADQQEVWGKKPDESAQT